MTITQSNLLVCIVLYEQRLDETSTFKSLQLADPASKKDFDVFIYDNSKNAQPQNIIENASKAFNTLHYEHDETNPGVSKAYNKAAQLAGTLNKKWLVLYDQDSTIHPNYFSELIGNINLNSRVRLFCPVVSASEKIISPSLFLFGRFFIKRSVSPGEKKLKYYSLINSGLAVQLDAFVAAGGYDEAFNLDFSDHYFINSFKKKFESFVVLNSTILQQLSSFEKSSFEKTYERFIIYFRSAILFSQKTHHSLPVFWAFMRALKLSVQYQNISFIKNAFRLFKR